MYPPFYISQAYRTIGTLEFVAPKTLQQLIIINTSHRNIVAKFYIVHLAGDLKEYAVYKENILFAEVLHFFITIDEQVKLYCSTNITKTLNP